MKSKLRVPPRPITECDQRIQYLRSFLGVVKSGISLSDYNGWCKNIRSDLAAIRDEKVRKSAQNLFGEVLSASHFIENHADRLEQHVIPTIDRLIDYLVANDQ